MFFFFPLFPFLVFPSFHELFLLLFHIFGVGHPAGSASTASGQRWLSQVGLGRPCAHLSHSFEAEIFI